MITFTDTTAAFEPPACSALRHARWYRQVRRCRAMTLVEVLAVVVILGLLAATFTVGFSGAFSKGKRELARTGIALIVGKLEIYHMEHSGAGNNAGASMSGSGGWPGNTEGLAVLTDGRATPTSAYYLSPDKLRDPWGNPYYYVTPGPDGHPFEVVCYGADGQPGGAGENADLSSTNLRKDQP